MYINYIKYIMCTWA